MAARARFAGELPRSEKAARGRTAVELTPLAIRSRVPLSDVMRETIRVQFGRRLARYAPQIERATVRVDDVNGPKGGVDLACKVKVVLSGLPSVVVEQRGADLPDVVTRAAEGAQRAVRRELQRRGRSSRPERGGGPAAKTEGKRGVRPIPDDEGSLIGARVGHARANLERALARPEKARRDVYVDTSAPGTSATDRKAGYGATARRNTKRNPAGMTAALEDSRTEPSRKSTRRSANRMRSGTALEHKASSRTVSSKARATRAQAAQRGKGPRR